MAIAYRGCKRWRLPLFERSRRDDIRVSSEHKRWATGSPAGPEIAYLAKRHWAAFEADGFEPRGHKSLTGTVFRGDRLTLYQLTAQSEGRIHNASS